LIVARAGFLVAVHDCRIDRKALLESLRVFWKIYGRRLAQLTKGSVLGVIPPALGGSGSGSYREAADVEAKAETVRSGRRKTLRK
jgi:hypothetical protein